MSNITMDYGHIKEEVHSVVGGKVLNYRTKRIYNRGVAQALADIDDATIKIAPEQGQGQQE